MFEFRTSAKYHISWGCCCSSSTSCAFARTNITQLRWLIDLYLYIDINKRIMWSIQALRLIYYLSLSDVVRWVLDFLYYFFSLFVGFVIVATDQYINMWPLIAHMKPFVYFFFFLRIWDAYCWSIHTYEIHTCLWWDDLTINIWMMRSNLRNK